MRATCDEDGLFRASGVTRSDRTGEDQDRHELGTEPHGRGGGYFRICVGLTLLSFLIFIVVDSFTSKLIRTTLEAFIEWVEEHPTAGVLAVILAYIVATVLFVPGSILTLGAGYAFGQAFDDHLHGVVLACISVFLGASLGSICSFLLGRYLFRDCVMHLASSYPVFQAVDRALQGNGLKIMILLRLSPLIPYNALDYMSGITSISLWAYSLALIALLPGTIMFVLIGSSASTLADATTNADNRTIRIVTMVLGIFFAVVGVTVASYYSKRELDQILTTSGSDPSVSPLTTGPETFSGEEFQSMEGSNQSTVV